MAAHLVPVPDDLDHITSDACPCGVAIEPVRVAGEVVALHVHRPVAEFAEFDVTEDEVDVMMSDGRPAVLEPV